MMNKIILLENPKVNTFNTVKTSANFEVTFFIILCDNTKLKIKLKINNKIINKKIIVLITLGSIVI